MDIIVKTVAGSHLFGTDTPTSDMDYKGVFVPTDREILLGNYKESRSTTTGPEHSKNSKDDIDVELYSIKKFMKMLGRGDTAALELLFTPEDKIVEKTQAWDEIVRFRHLFLSRQVSAMIGYARQQANKYGIKGSRMGELSKMVEVLKKIEKTFDFQNPKLKHGWDQVIEGIKDLDHVHQYTVTMSGNFENTEVPALNILGKKFDHHCTFSHVLQILTKIYKNYGQRAREAKKNNGIDWKALSHAVRVSIQGIELLNTGHITLPLKAEDRTLVKLIKAGKIDYKEVAVRLEELLLELESAKLTSELPEKLEQSFLDEMVIDIHRGIVNGSN